MTRKREHSLPSPNLKTINIQTTPEYHEALVLTRTPIGHVCIGIRGPQILPDASCPPDDIIRIAERRPISTSHIPRRDCRGRDHRRDPSLLAPGGPSSRGSGRLRVRGGQRPGGDR